MALRLPLCVNFSTLLTCRNASSGNYVAEDICTDYEMTIFTIYICRAALYIILVCVQSASHIHTEAIKIYLLTSTMSTVGNEDKCVSTMKTGTYPVQPRVMLRCRTVCFNHELAW